MSQRHRESGSSTSGSPASSNGRSGANGRFDATLIVGRLKAHGLAPFQFRRDNEQSYFLRLSTQQGERTVWGVDLARALIESQTHPRIGDMIGARRIGREPVTATTRGGADEPARPPMYRNRWCVEKLTFFAQRARLARQLRDEHADTRAAVREHPELLSTYMTLRGLTLAAEQRFPDPATRAQFLDFVREAIAASVSHGKPLPSVELRTQAAVDKKVPRKDRDDPTR